MKKTFLFFLFTIFSAGILSYGQKKLLAEINSVSTKETITFKYNGKNQLIYFDEKSILTYSEYTLKYDKLGRLSECIINQDRGELVLSSKFLYGENNSIVEETKSSGIKVKLKSITYDTIRVDNKGRLTKTTFEDGAIWEEFTYDDNDNLTNYKVHSVSKGNDRTSNSVFGTNKSPFVGITGFPLWFWALQVNKARWCRDLIGRNSPIENETDTPYFGIDTTEITYEYDEDGYPVKQYYNGELAKEFKYKAIK